MNIAKVSLATLWIPSFSPPPQFYVSPSIEIYTIDVGISNESSHFIGILLQTAFFPLNFTFLRCTHIDTNGSCPSLLVAVLYLFPWM